MLIDPEIQRCPELSLGKRCENVFHRRQIEANSLENFADFSRIFNNSRELHARARPRENLRYTVVALIISRILYRAPYKEVKRLYTRGTVLLLPF